MRCKGWSRPCLATAELDKRVTLQERVQVLDETGGFSSTWTKVADLWAKIEPVSGMQVYRMAQTEAPITHKVTVRYRSGVTTKQRLLFKGRVLDIVEVLNPEEANVSLIMRCREGELDA